jgi:hypothetical protein
MSPQAVRHVFGLLSPILQRVCLTSNIRKTNPRKHYHHLAALTRAKCISVSIEGEFGVHAVVELIDIDLR